MNSDEIMLKKSLTLYVEQYAAAFPESNSYEDEFTLSDNFSKKMDKLVSLQCKKIYSLVNTHVKRVILIAAIISVIMVTMLFGVSAFREKIQKFFVESYNKFSVVLFESINNQGRLWLKNDVPKSLPGGFTLEDRQIETLSVRLEYINSDGVVVLVYKSTTDCLNMNSQVEIGDCTTTTVDGKEGFYYFANGSTNLMWVDSLVAYHITSTLPIDEILEIARQFQ